MMLFLPDSVTDANFWNCLIKIPIGLIAVPGAGSPLTLFWVCY